MASKSGASSELVTVDPVPRFGKLTLKPGELHVAELKPSGSDSETLFSLIDPSHSGVEVGMILPNLRKNMREILRLACYGGICTGDFDADGLADFLVTSPAGGSRLFRNRGDFKFEDVTESTGLQMLTKDFWGTGASFVDIDNDGDLDLFCCGYGDANLVFINRGLSADGNVRFVESSKQLGLDQKFSSMTMAFADIDNDGDLDGYLATTGRAPEGNVRFRTVRRLDGTLTVPSELAEVWTIYTKPDGKPHRVEAGQFDHLFRNDQGKFVDVSKEAGIKGPFFTLSAIWYDYDDDGRPDLYASNDYWGSDQLYHNNGDGTFTDQIASVMPYTSWFSMGADIGDVNNDGRIDLFTTDMAAPTHVRSKIAMGDMAASSWFLDSAIPRQYMRNCLFLNTGLDRMLESASMSGLSSTNWTWGGRIEDYDNDGYVDLLVTNGALRDTMHSDTTKYADDVLGTGSRKWLDFWESQPMLKEANIALKNIDGTRFKDVSADWGFDRVGVSFGCATADFDNDGDLDVVINNADAPVGIYRNNSRNQNRICVRLEGVQSNRYGLGATVQVNSGGKSQTRYLTQTRGWLSSSEPVLHFGLAKAETIDCLTIKWPSGVKQEFTNLPANSLFSICEPANDSTLESASQLAGVPKSEPLFHLHQLDQIKHSERNFDDFARQPLLPNKSSQLGPGIAVGDVDRDGDEDIFMGQGAGMPAKILFNDKGELAYRSDRQRPLTTGQNEDMGALFFDVEGDGDLDLYVVSGGVECEPNDERLQDRLYLNDGQGSFSLADKDALPELRSSGSCVVAADFDKDGDLDLFVGGRVVPGAYPTTPNSYLLRNDSSTGKPKLTNVTNELATQLSQAGMVTSAIWSDVDNDHDADLLVCLEWGSVKLFRNAGGKFAEATAETGIENRKGWWNSINGRDVDHDGDIDYVVTNFGSNTKYHPDESHPYRLYYKDFDRDGKADVVESKVVKDTFLPVRGFS